MAGERAREPYFGVTSFPGEWLAWLSGPARFLARIDLERRDDRRHALDVFFTGLTGTIAFSALNLWQSPAQSAANQKLLQGDAVTLALLLGGVTVALAATLLSWVAGGRRSPAGALVTFGYTLGYLWPTTTLVLIAVSRAGSALLGFDWTAVAPFDKSIGGFMSPTPVHVAIAAILVTVLIWLLGFCLYAYAVAIRAAQGIPLAGAFVVAVLAAAATTAASPWLGNFASAIGERYGPLIEWLLRIFT